MLSITQLTLSCKMYLYLRRVSVKIFVIAQVANRLCLTFSLWITSTYFKDMLKGFVMCVAKIVVYILCVLLVDGLAQ
jgi:hypothetical protein